MPAPLTPDEFCQVFADRILAKDPRLQMEMRGELELGIFPPQEPGQSFTLELENAYHDYLDEPANLRAVMDRFIQLTLAAFAQGELDKLMPVVQHVSYLDLLTAEYLDAGYEPHEVDVYHEMLNDELIVLLEVQRVPGTVTYLTHTDLANFGMEVAAVRAHAVGNLLDRLPYINAHGNDDLYVVTAADFPVASLLMAAPIWSTATFPVRGDFVAAVPASEVLLVTGSGHPYAIAGMHDFIANTFAGSPHAISPALFVMHGLHWDIYPD